MQQAVVIGYGSMGRRHVNALESLGLDVSVLSRRDIEDKKTYSDFVELYNNIANAKDTYIVVANETACHVKSLRSIIAAGHVGPILIEKPIFSKSEVIDLRSNYRIFVGYNLRFFKLVTILREKLDGSNIYSASFSVGQFLPTWRPGRDYSKVYSASVDQGGGVLRDLSHEIDLLLWLLGPIKRVVALTGCSGVLLGDSEDYAHVLVEGFHFRAATLYLDYLDKNNRRTLTFQSDRGTLTLDLIAGTLTENGSLVCSMSADWDDICQQQHRAALSGETDIICGFKEGCEVVRVIEAIEESSETGLWQNL